MRSVIDNPMREYERIAEYLKSPTIKMDKLAQYAQGANPRVPEFLALAEIKSRQSMVANSGAAGPVQTVKEDLVRSATPQPVQQMQQQMPQQMAGLQAMQRPQGVAALPSGMDGQSMAGGGIVAFDDGGYVDNYDDGYAGGGIVAFANGSQGAIDDPDAGLGYFEKLKRYVNNLVGTPVDRFGVPIKKDGTLIKPNEAAVNATQAEIQGVRTGKNPAMLSSDADAQVGGYYGGAKPTPTQFLQAHPNITNEDVMGPGASPTGDKGGPKIPSKEAADLLTKEGAPKEDMYAKYEKMLMEQATQGKADRKQDKYMRLLEAGLGIMGGTSQHALTNIGQGAMGAAKGYAQDKAGYRKEDRDNVKELMALGMKKEDAAREAEKMAMTKDLYGAHGRYYDAAAKAAGVRAANTGANAGIGMSKAQLTSATSMYNKWFSSNPMASQEEQDAAWLQAQQRSGMSGGASASPAVMGTYSLKGGYSPTGS
jgi:hypothetical protein